MDSVLDFSRTGTYNIFPITIGIHIQKLLKRWRPRMSNVNINHHIQIAPNTPRVMGDRIALDQVFTNIISNAVKAMSDEGGILAIKVVPETAPSGRKMVKIDISDTGPGIPEEIIDRVFEPFFSTHKESGGTGLGLAISKQIITAHKGNIKVSSFPGGTVFHIVLPAEIEEMGD
jgi:signal transduction histidine kinase